MDKREEFINCVNEAIEKGIFTEAAIEFFNEIKDGKKKNSSPITDNGKKILNFMQAEEDSFGNAFKAKEIAAGIFSNSRSVSGAMKKLYEDGYVDKIIASPIIYSLTDKGRETLVD